MLGIEFAEQEHLYAGSGLLLVAVKPGREHLGVVEHHHITLIKEVYYFLEYMMADFTGFGINHHQTAFVSVFRRIKSYAFLREFEFELRQFHNYCILSPHTCGRFSLLISFREFQRTGFYHFYSLVERETFFDGNVADTGTAQGGQMRSRTESDADVPRQRPDIRTLAANHPQSKPVSLKIQQLNPAYL